MCNLTRPTKLGGMVLVHGASACRYLSGGEWWILFHRTFIAWLGLRAAEVIEVCFPRIYKECPLSRTFDPLRCTSEAS